MSSTCQSPYRSYLADEDQVHTPATPGCERLRGTEADHAAALAAAEAARQDGYNQAYTNFAALAMPVITQQGSNDAAAEFFQRRTLDDDDLADIMHNNQAVDGYQDEGNRSRPGVAGT